VDQITDMINRLEEHLLCKHVYPKMFVKLKKSGGKVLLLFGMYIIYIREQYIRNFLL